MCFTNMTQKSKELGCELISDEVDPPCVCKVDNFRYGLRDCSREACGEEVLKAVMDWYYNDLCGKCCSDVVDDLER